MNAPGCTKLGRTLIFGHQIWILGNANYIKNNITLEICISLQAQSNGEVGPGILNPTNCQSLWYGDQGESPRMFAENLPLRRVSVNSDNSRHIIPPYAGCTAEALQPTNKTEKSGQACIHVTYHEHDIGYRLTGEGSLQRFDGRGDGDLKTRRSSPVRRYRVCCGDLAWYMV